MKNFQLKPKPSLVRTLKEPVSAQQKGFNWQRWSWTAILLVALFFAGRHVYVSFALIQGEGQVELNKQAVMFTNDIRVLSIMVTEGDTVQRGDTLFLYQNELDNDANGGAAMSVSMSQPVDWIERERLQLRRQIDLKKLAAASFERKIEFTQQELSRQQDLVLLGVNHIERDLLSLQSDILTYQTERDVVVKEIATLRRHLAQLHSQERKMAAFAANQFAQQAATQVYIAKMDGIIGQINFNNNEVCYEKQDVLTVHQKGNIRIKAYFDPDETPYIAAGDIVDIEFPDGTWGEGIIHNFYVSTYALPAEFQKRYEPVERNVVVDVLPLNDLEAGRWMSFYKMEVHLSKSKY